MRLLLAVLLVSGCAASEDTVTVESGPVKGMLQPHAAVAHRPGVAGEGGAGGRVVQINPITVIKIELHMPKG